MRAVRSLLCGVFALGFLFFVRLSALVLLDIVRRPSAHFPATLASASATLALPVLSAVYGMAFWSGWRARPSARTWGMAASAANSLLAGFFFVVDGQALGQAGTALFRADALLLVIGVAGFFAFTRLEAIQDEPTASPVSGDGTHGLLNRAVWLVGAGGFLAGIVAWSRWGHGKGLPAFGNSIVHELGLLVVAELAMVAVHELGHAAVARGLGMKLRAFIVGPLQWRLRDGHWEFRFILFGLFGIGGGTAAVPRNRQQPVWRELCMVAAGPAGSFAAGFLALALALTAPGHFWQPAWGLLAFFSTLSLLTSALNCIPFRAGSFYSDGARIAQMLSGGLWADLHRAFSAAAATTVTPLRPRDYDIAAIERASASIAAGEDALLLRLLASSYYLDWGRLPEAGKALSEAEALYQQSQCDLPADLWTSFIFGKAYVQRDSAGTLAWWERLEAQKPPQQTVDYWLARSAACWAEQRLDDAWESWEKGNALAQKSPNVGAYETDRDLFALLRRELEASRTARMQPGLVVNAGYPVSRMAISQA